VSDIEATVIVPTYNQAGSLGSCLASLAAQTIPSDRYEILVIDDGSTDGTAGVLAGFAAPVRVVRLPHNRGRSTARNVGLQEARAERVVFVDSDVVVRADFLEWHSRTHRKYGPGILSRGPVVSVETLDQISHRRIPRFAASPAYLDTANAALDRTAVIRAGMFDEAFPGYGWEDFELGFRLRRNGIRRVFCRQAPAFHLQPPVRARDLDALFAKEEARARSAVYFYRKHPTLETRLLIQATTLHWFLYWLMAGAGALHRGNLPVVVRRLEAGRLAFLAPLAARSVLNRHYLASLAQEFASHAPGTA
jgi:glycosyltransferase involved in cell wall biosynthesis